MRERPILFSGEMVRAILDGRKTQTRRVVKFPKHVTGTPGSIHEDGGGNWVAWSPGKSAGLAEFTKRAYPNGEGFPCPYGKPGDRLWVRETWRPVERESDLLDGVVFRADDQFRQIENSQEAAEKWMEAYAGGKPGNPWRPSIFMPRWAARTLLDIVSIRVERLQDISEEDAIAEGVPLGDRATLPDETPRHALCVHCHRRGNEHVGVSRVCVGRSTCFNPRTYKGGFAFLWDRINGTRGDWNSSPWVWVVEFRKVKEGSR